MSDDLTLKDLMEDLALQSEIHDKTKLEERRANKLKEKTHKDEVKRKRQRVSRAPESEEERRLRKYPQQIVEID
jgi:hypothetical protein